MSTEKGMPPTREEIIHAMMLIDGTGHFNVARLVAQRAAEALLSLEWSLNLSDSMGQRCPTCQQQDDVGHAEICQMARLIAAWKRAAEGR